MQTDFSPELTYTTSRSSGPGGQHVNKVNTKVELRFNVRNSIFLSDKQKELIMERLANRINNEGILILTSDSERSQLKNKQRVTERFNHLIINSLKKRKIRKATKPTAQSKEKRLKKKKMQAEKKVRRKTPGNEQHP
jgi:ribosome-associated protein